MNCGNFSDRNTNRRRRSLVLATVDAIGACLKNGYRAPACKTLWISVENNSFARQSAGEISSGRLIRPNKKIRNVDALASFDSFHARMLLRSGLRTPDSGVLRLLTRKLYIFFVFRQRIVLISLSSCMGMDQGPVSVQDVVCDLFLHSCPCQRHRNMTAAAAAAAVSDEPVTAVSIQAHVYPASLPLRPRSRCRIISSHPFVWCWCVLGGGGTGLAAFTPNYESQSVRPATTTTKPPTIRGRRLLGLHGSVSAVLGPLSVTSSRGRIDL